MGFDGIEGKVAIITGAGGGIGEAYARGFAREGAKVVVAEIDKEGGERVAEAIRKSGGEAVFVKTDVGSEDSTAAAAQAAIDAFGGIDFLVNNAAIFKDMKLSSLLQVEWDYYKHFMNVNVDGALLMARACWGSMKQRGGGSIVNQSSTAAYMGVGYYGMSKLAINGLTQALARQLGPHNIRGPSLAPGPAAREARRKEPPVEYQKQLVATLPLSRLGQPEDMVGTCLFLCSSASAWVTGQVIAVDGGQVVRA